MRRWIGCLGAKCNSRGGGPHPPLEGEGRCAWSEAECAAGRGESLSAETLPEWRDHPTPLALRAIDPPPPGEGKKDCPQLFALAESSIALKASSSCSEIGT